MSSSGAQEEADKKAHELAQVKAEFAELKARLQKAEEKKHVILERYVSPRAWWCLMVHGL